MKATPTAVPRLASTVLLLANSNELGGYHGSSLFAHSRMERNDIHVLMVRRHSKARFMPEMYVFPGGCVEEEDLDVVREVGFLLPREPAGETDVEQRLRQEHLEEEAWRSRVAALRELSEETSCVLRADGAMESVEDWRSSAAGIASKRAFDAAAAPHLTPIGHWITPENYEYRYDTYFYGAALREGDEKDVCRGRRLSPHLVKLQSQEREISRLLWVSPLEALIRHELPSEAFTLPPPTFHLLSALARAPSFASLAGQWRQRLRRRPPPAATLEETAFQAVTPVMQSAGGVECVHIPECSFHNMGADGAPRAGHYRMPDGGATEEGKTRYVDVFVGGCERSATPQLLSVLKS